MLDWTKLFDEDGGVEKNVDDIERVQVLKNINAALKMGGVSILSFPEGAFDLSDPSNFNRFIKALEDHFGFQMIGPLGMSFATDIQPERRIGWMITMKKIGELDMRRLNPYNLEMLSDRRIMVSKYRKRTRPQEPVVVNIDYPIHSAKEFTIYNPVTGEESSANSQGEDTISWFSEFKHSLPRRDLSTLNWARRQIENGLGLNYKEAEAILAIAISEVDIEELFTKNRLDRIKMTKLVKWEIRRRKR
jgi:hypothetical protein